jgi:hypothetical protein
LTVAWKAVHWVVSMVPLKADWKVTRSAADWVDSMVEELVDN